MKLSFTIKEFVLSGVIALLIILLLLGNRKHRLETDRLNTVIFQESDSITHLTIEVAKQKINAFYAQAAVVSTSEVVKNLTRENEYLKKLKIKDVKTISNLKMEIAVLKKQGEYKDTVVDEPYIDDELIIDDPADIQKIIKKDTIRFARFNDQYAWCSVWLYPSRPQFDFGLHPATVKVIVGYQGVIRVQPVAVVTSDNPYINIKKNNTIIVDEDKKLWHKRYPWLIAGAVGGFLLAR